MENKLLIIEDDRLTSAFLEMTLKQNKFKCATASTVENSIAILRQQKFFMAFLDLNLPDGSGFKILDYINQNAIDTAIVVLSAMKEPELIIKSFKLGAVDYLIKPVTEDTLFAAIENAKRKKEGDFPLLRKNLSFICEKKILSPREYQILKMVVSGEKYQSINKKLFISHNTFKTHLKSIFKKMQLNDRTEIVYQFNCCNIRDHLG